jgi:thermostable 8-oxoguanine DNA glycosylase
METLCSNGDIPTLLTTSDRRVLRRIVRLFGRLVEDEVAPLGRYRTMTQDEVWHLLVGQICVMGSARHMESIRSDPGKRQEFESAVSLESVKREQFPVSYLARILRAFSATRFPKKSADRLGGLFESPTVFQRGKLILYEGLSHEGNRDKVRDELIERCRPVFRLKSASNFMIAAGLSHDVIALDTRVVGLLQKHLGYNLNSTRIQSQRGLYLSLEAALRDFCHEQSISLALLDRILFGFSNMGAIELIVKYPELTRRLG